MRTLVSVSVHVALAMAACASAGATDIFTSGDTYVDTAVPAGTFGTNGIVAVSGTRTALIKFDTATINKTPGRDAVLFLNVVQLKNFQNGVTAHIIRGPWNEKTVTANTLPPISEIPLDRMLVTRDFKTFGFNAAGALAAWRNDPAQNFGIALRSATPAANMQVGARELKNGAMLRITGPAPDRDRRFWVGTQSSIDLYATDGTHPVSLLALAGKDVQLASGPRSLANDPRTGGVWVANTNGNQVVRIGPDGTIQLSLNVSSPMAAAADPRDGGFWTTIVDANGINRSLVKLNRAGQQVVRVSGFEGLVWDVALDAATNRIWLTDTRNESVVRLTGTDAQLNGYNASASSGTRHTRFAFGEPFAVSVNPNNDGMGVGNVWVGNRTPGEITKLSRTGAELFTTVPSTGFEVQGIEADVLYGGAAALVVNGNEGFVQITPGGNELRFIRAFTSVSDFRTLKFASFPTAVVLDPWRDQMWGGIWETTWKNGSITKQASYMAGFNLVGHETHFFKVRDRVFSAASQAIGASMTVANGGVVNVNGNFTTTISVLSNVDFDALQIDPAHARLGRAGAFPLNVTAGDKNGDGRPDLTLDFANTDTFYICTDRNVGFTGLTFGGVPVSANAPITIQGC